MNLETCEHTGAAGAAELQGVFNDPDFSAEVPAFYYVRVFENPTCRWSTVLANTADVDPPARPAHRRGFRVHSPEACLDSGTGSW